MNLLFRTDATVAMGTGHVMRCLALAQGWLDAGGSATFAMADATPSVEARLRLDPLKLVRLAVAAGSDEDASQTAELARAENCDWVVVDGYQFTSQYQSALRQAGVKVLFIDDNGEAAPYTADLVLNQNLHASEDLYRRREPYTRLLLGPRYVLLRREFSFWRNRKFEVQERARRVLITMGGSDPENVTEQVLSVLLEEPDLELTVVVGGSNPHLGSLEALAQRANHPVRLLKDVPDMPSLMVWADLAVAGAGTTSWELCMMGLPAALCVLAPNQEKIASELARLGAAVNLDYVCRTPRRRTEGLLREVIRSEEMRSRMSARGREIVDGRGVEHVRAFLRREPVLRKTIEADCKSFWEWANEPAETAVSAPRKSIPWDRHMEWFRARLADPQSVLYTAVNRQGDPVGMVRCQLNGRHAVLSISVGAAFRGRGSGRTILCLAVEELFRNSRIAAIEAFVRASNQPSIRLFEGAGFRKAGTETVDGTPALRYVLDKSVLNG